MNEPLSESLFDYKIDLVVDRALAASQLQWLLMK